MGTHHVIRPWESALFRRCRRAWDLGARERQDYEPVEPAGVFDFDEAVREALEVYYFPGMWDWDRVIVRPLAVKAFDKSMWRQRAAYEQHRELSAEQRRDFEERLEQGADLLARYFDWALEVDRFTPIQVAAQFDVTIPDPDSPGDGLTTPDGRGIWYRVRVDMVVMDEHELYWLVEHRVADPAWRDLDELLLDEQSLTRSWAWQLGFLGDLEGTIHTELRPGASHAAETTDVAAHDGPSGFIIAHRSESFRRTEIPRGPTELHRRGVEVALETKDMIDPALRVYPNPVWEHCAVCAYRSPCIAMTQGLDERLILEQSYRRRSGPEFEPGRLGSVWGFVPDVYRVAEHRAPGGGGG
ncbi:MAG: hypothetical protein GEV09_00670 [Pseudonocardiaceae bacterium]|nr:hypothetical protein [Pseudonocardiaceae bacterium]